MDRSILTVALSAAFCMSCSTGSAANPTDEDWGQTRCDLVSPENREPCMAAHVRLGMPSDETAVAGTPTAAKGSASPVDEGTTDVPEVARAKKVVAERMKDPTSVLFKNVVYIEARQAVCGNVNAKNSYGAYAGYSRFVVGPGGEVHTFDGSTSCYGSDQMSCYKRKMADIQAIKENCESTAAEPKFPDNPKELRERVEALGEDDGAMSWVLQEDAMTWLERNLAATDPEVVKAMVDLCDLMSNRGSRRYATRLATIEEHAANNKVRSECGEAREEVEDME